MESLSLSNLLCCPGIAGRESELPSASAYDPQLGHEEVTPGRREGKLKTWFCFSDDFLSLKKKKSLFKKPSKGNYLFFIFSGSFWQIQEEWHGTVVAK